MLLLPSFISLTLATFFSFAIQATTFTTTSNNNWTPYNPNTLAGNHVGTTSASDTFIIRHNAEILGMVLHGTIIIEDGGKMKPSWSLEFKAGSNIQINDGGKLEVKSIVFTTYSTNFTVEGELKTESCSSYNYGDINITTNGKWKDKSSAIYNYGNIQFDGELNVESSSFYNQSGGAIVLNNKAKFKSAAFYNQSGATLTGYGYIDYHSASGYNSGTVNGCSGNNCISSDPTYLANVPTNNNFIVYKNGSFPSTDCNSIVQILKNVDINSETVIGTLIVTPGKKVKVKSDKSLSICNKIINNGEVELENAASLVQTSSTNENEGVGVYLIEREGTFNVSKYNTWSSPISNARIEQVFENNNFCDLYTYDGSIQKWKYDYPLNFQATCNGNPVTFGNQHILDGADGIMDVARGYFATGDDGPGNSKREFEGTVNNGPITFPIFTTSVGNNPNWNGDDWNLVGNPYPSAIDVDPNNANSFTNVNSNIITGDIYFWVDDSSEGNNYHQSSDYAIYNVTGGISANGSEIPNGRISSGQGFWVLATQTGHLEFSNIMRKTGENSNFFKQDNSRTRLWFDLTNDSNNFNQILIGFDNNASTGYDQGMDAPKAEGNTSVAFSTMIKNEEYSIQALPELIEDQSTTVELSIKTTNPGLHTISLSNFENLENVIATFIDTKTGKEQIVNDSPYNVYLDTAGTYHNRFFVRILKTSNRNTSIEDLETNLLRTYQNGPLLTIDAIQELSNLKTITIYNTVGKEIIKLESASSKKETININGLSTGIYIIGVELENGKSVRTKSYLQTNN